MDIKKGRRNWWEGGGDGSIVAMMVETDRNAAAVTDDEVTIPLTSCVCRPGPHHTVKNLRTPCCTQVTKTKDSYLYQTSRSAEKRWHAGV